MTNANTKNEQELKLGVSPTLFPPKKTIPSVESEMWKTIFEEFSYVGNDFDEFLRYLGNKETLTCRAIVQANKMEFFALNDKWYQKFLKNGFPKELIDDALKHTGLGVKIGRHAYPVGESSMPSLWRIAIASRDIVAKNIVADFFNASIANRSTQRGTVSEYLGMFYGGKLDGLMSSIYTPFPPKQFMATASNAITAEYGENECVSTYFDHDTFKAVFALKGEEARNMNDLFREQVALRYERNGRKLTAEEKRNINVEFGLVVRTGETGNETATIRSHVSLTRGCGIAIGEDIVLYHKGEKNLEEEISKKIGNVFLSFQDVINRLIVACDIKVLDWRATIIGLAEYAKIPEDVWKKIVVNFEENHKNINIVTGYDIYSAFLDSTEIYRQNNVGATENALNLFEMKIQKILNEDIAKYDNNEAMVRATLGAQYLTYPQTVLVKTCDELKIPVAIRKRLVENLSVRANMYSMANQGEEMPTTSLDIYELIVNSGSYMRDWYAKKNLETDELESKMAKYQKSLTKAKDVCYIAFDKEVI